MIKMLKYIYNKCSVQVTKSETGFVNEFKIHKIILWPLGLWPLEEMNMSKAIRYILAILSQVYEITSI